MPRTALALLALVALCAAALAASLGSAYPSLDTEVQNRLAAIPGTGLTKAQKKLKATLASVAAALSHDAASLTETLSDSSKVVAALDKAFPGEFDTLLDPVATDAAQAVDVRFAAVQSATSALPDGKTKAKIQKLVTKAETAIASATSAATRTERLKFLAAALKSIVKAEKAIATANAGGGGDVTATELDFDVGAEHGHLPAAGNPTASWAAISSGGGAAFTLTVFLAPSPNATHSFTFFVLSPGSGTHKITSIGSSYSSTAIPSALQLTSGSIKFTVWNPGQHKCKGTFTAKFGGTTLTGSFATIDLKTP